MRLHFVFVKCSGYTFFVTLISGYTLVTKWILNYTVSKQIFCLFKALKFNSILIENSPVTELQNICTKPTRTGESYTG